MLVKFSGYRESHDSDKAVARHSWWRYQMEAFCALLALFAGNSPVTGEFPSKRLVTRSFDVFFHLCLNKRLCKQSWGWWFETPSCLLWRHRNGYDFISTIKPYTDSQEKWSHASLRKKRNGGMLYDESQTWYFHVSFRMQKKQKKKCIKLFKFISWSVL